MNKEYETILDQLLLQSVYNQVEIDSMRSAFIQLVDNLCKESESKNLVSSMYDYAYQKKLEQLSLLEKALYKPSLIPFEKADLRDSFQLQMKFLDEKYNS
jgi:hypothetical protein